MASLAQPKPYSYYPAPGSVEHASRPAPNEGRASFGPVLVVLAVISFLSLAACVAGRICSRGSSSRRNSPSEQQSADPEKGFNTDCPTVMRPVPSSRAAVHDVHDAFEIKVVPPKPAGWEATGGGHGIRLQALPQLRPYTAARAGAAGFRGPATGNGGAVRQAHPQVRSGVPFAPPQQRR
ncbi:uncharacterized protein LOC133930150 [Phragmites australis]|uniref:uncharacterized protein LOC133930150 n=1 Tax=Phragmites australis TaxID=29695 RepID=UPI002D77959F|nr:uncharacterized protein LOC133930150 [Phragmites australis]